MPRLPSNVRQAAAKVDAPLWTGPCSDGPNGGVTFSMLNRFLTCRERFRVAYLEGWKTQDAFNHRIEYGHMWHRCEEALARGPSTPLSNWKVSLDDYAKDLCRKYPRQQEDVVHWWNVCKTQFPLYVEHWRQHPDVKVRKPLLQEKVFNVPHQLPSGRTVRLKGKWDSVDVIDGRLWVQENKTKGDVDELLLTRQLTGDLQSMIYLIALAGWQQPVKCPIAGVRYNVVRRPLSGGKGNIKRHQPTKKNPQGETAAEFYARLGALIRTAYGPEWGMPPDQNYFFLRFNVEVSAADVKRFQQRSLNPILEQLCDWWDWIGKLQQNPFDTAGSGGIHWQHPFGCANMIDEYGASDLDTYLATGNTVGLQRRVELFEELRS